MIKSSILPICLFLLFGSCTANKESPNLDFIPLADLQKDSFQDKTGGLYANGSNRIPKNHYKEGLKHSSMIEKLDQSGQADSNGNIILLGLGFSTAAMTFNTASIILNYKNTYPSIDYISGAQGGQDINKMTDSKAEYWKTISARLDSAGLSENQVQIAWLSTGDLEAGNLSLKEHIAYLLPKYSAVLKNLKLHYQNLQIVFISDRTFAGYINSPAATSLKEPSAYYNGFVVQQLINNQVLEVEGFTYNELPFIDWGPQLWTNGRYGDSHGYKWLPNDAGDGGIHPSPKGKVKEGIRLYLYLEQHPYLKSISAQ